MKSSTSTVTRTYRVAMKIGENYTTVEETITLPVNASDEEIAQAADLGLRIYHAQYAAVEAQVSGLRELSDLPPQIVVREPDTAASDKQRNYISTLQDGLGWDAEHLSGYAREQSVDIATLTKGQASTLIDDLKKLIDERASYTDGTPSRTDNTVSRPIRSDTYAQPRYPSRRNTRVPVSSPPLTGGDGVDDTDIPF